MQYYLDFCRSSDGEPRMHIREYDDAKWGPAKPFGTKSLSVFNGGLIVAALFDSIVEAVRDLDGYSRPVILPDGSEVSPYSINYPYPGAAARVAEWKERYSKKALSA